ncbi:hypothetical protein JCGZ_21995 [Jatropha curcas]|uniref:Uncharacterized protein n=1 Tax=Jatropha curcas TaxID=180498 RepID=A0A067JPR9_JATCU|nr:probable indole-3-acetic acid-amido synthetase GH3.6 [Jatropha curcas]KDP21524.1 hypothetical protein JCGZ_21995 [Jatropha curcas]
MADEELLQKLEDLTKDAVHHQLQTLCSILEHQAGVSYLRPFLAGHHESIDAANFHRRVPLSCYDDYADHINRMANGELDHSEPVFSVDPLLCFFYSSGTSTMNPKLIPYFDSALSRAASYIAHQGSSAIFRRLFPPKPEVNKILWFLYVDVTTTTRGGFKVMAASTYPFSKTSEVNWSQVLPCISPPEVLLGTDIENQMYCHLLCALRNSDLIDGIRAPYAIGIVKAFSLLESKWKQLCDDLENGFLSTQVTNPAMRESVSNILDGPQPDLSKRFRSIFEEKNWNGIVSKLWCNVRYVKCVITGSMKQYYPKLKYYAGEIMILGGDYFASECPVGINLDIRQPPEATRFVMLPTAAYFEFLPFDMNEQSVVSEKAMTFSDVDVGKTYEVVVTTYRGLYRYRLGDIVRVVGFHNSSPEVEFVMRAPKTADEIITERDLISAMESLISVEIIEFASFLDLETSPKQLKVFIELREEKLQESIEALKKCCYSLEDGLGGIYKVERDKGKIGPLSVYIVKPGSFNEILLVAVENGAPASQYKPPKIIRNRKIVDVMESSVLVAVSADSSCGL